MTKISKTVIKNYRKLKLGKIINFSEIESAKEKLDQIDLELKEKIERTSSDPSHKVYSIIQNLLSYFVEELSIHKEFEEYYDKIEIVEDEYMPSFPPGSPLTGSYFTYWAFCDLRFGKEKETIITIFSDLGIEFNFDEIVMKGLSNLNTSYMGFYRHMGFDDDLIILKDLLTDKEFCCICTSGYKGRKDEIWYIRVVPNLDKVYDYQITLTTPYVIIKYTEKDWLDFFQRQGVIKGGIGYQEKYSDFMKYNIDFRYWHNYVMDGYFNHRPDCIYLTGIPDIKGSKPHELENEF
jgi:hypothetical protein